MPAARRTDAAPVPVSGKRPPVLLVPGAFTGPWIWEDNFQSGFSAAGYDTHTMAFRGFGKGLRQQLSIRIENYVEDLNQAIDHLPEMPVIVGYSLGGLVTSLVASQRPLAAAILLSPVPASGFSRHLLAYGRKSPLSALKMTSLSLFPPARHLGKAPLGIYSPELPEETGRKVTRKLSREPLGGLLATLRAYPVEAPDFPVRVIGAEGDHLVPPAASAEAAKTLGGSLRIFPGLSHSLMFEDGAGEVMEDMLQWLDETVIAPAA